MHIILLGRNGNLRSCMHITMFEYFCQLKTRCESPKMYNFTTVLLSGLCLLFFLYLGYHIFHHLFSFSTDIFIYLQSRPLNLKPSFQHKMSIAYNRISADVFPLITWLISITHSMASNHKFWNRLQFSLIYRSVHSFIR